MADKSSSYPQSSEERDLLNNINGRSQDIERPQQQNTAVPSTPTSSTRPPSTRTSSRASSTSTDTISFSSTLAAGKASTDRAAAFIMQPPACVVSTAHIETRRSATTFHFNPHAPEFIPSQTHFVRHPSSSSDRCLGHDESMAAIFPNLNEDHRPRHQYQSPVIAEGSSSTSHRKRRPGHYRRGPEDVDAIGREYLATRQLSDMPQERAWAARSSQVSTNGSSRPRLDAQVSAFEPGVNWYESERRRKETEQTSTQNHGSHSVAPRQAANSLSLDAASNCTTTPQLGLSNGLLPGSSAT
ncbi:hypothetical protein GGR57DRAFT_503214 [Xylariaceae sp. FL1272]|nr:hypothetical protein GGR57DRAFT_503214 [Xylariaceae sp. FL1272]